MDKRTRVDGRTDERVAGRADEKAAIKPKNAKPKNAPSKNSLPNLNALSNLNVLLKIMEKEAKKKNAPVFSLERKSDFDPFHILIATMLSTRTKDEKTMEAAQKLFSVVSTPQDISSLPTKKLEKLIYGVGFYRVKARNIKKTSEILIRKFHGKVPSDREALLELPGVGRKVANIVLASAYGKNTLGVDTHVHRISNRLGLVKTKNPLQTERALLAIIPKNLVRKINRIFVAYGQTICLPLRPRCDMCAVRKYCARRGVK